MSDKNLIRALNLQLFADGGAGGEGGTGADGSSAEAGMPATSANGVKNPLASVVYGKQEAQSAAVQTETQTAEVAAERDLNAEFEALIKGDFKEQYNARVQDTVQKRLKGSKETVDRYNALAPTLDMLGKKYGVDANDIEALNKAIAEDDSYYEEEALEKGITVDQLKEIKKMERENAELRRQMEQRQEQEQIEQDIANWMEQAEKAKLIYPNLDLGVELQNPQFIDLMKSGVNLETAYFAIHKDDLVPQAMQFAAQTAQKNVTNKIAANGQRPDENGLHKNSSAVVKSDVSQLTKADRAEIARRVARGEKITF